MTKLVPSYTYLLKHYLCAIITIWFGGCALLPQKPPVTPIMPYETGDQSLSCSELNREIGALNERMSRLMEQSERDERQIKSHRTTTFAGALGGLLSLNPFPVVDYVLYTNSKKNEELYGTETGHLLQTYQERVKHLEEIGRTKGC